ncbi:hypothetical protein [Pseudonocardia sp.]|uniref:hypothetical protein n=1 Tax=Pseudonocardia sp. TaxID=60912 RepID=UPI003D0E8377
MTRHRRSAARPRRRSTGRLLLAVAVPALVALVASLLPIVLNAPDSNAPLDTSPDPAALVVETSPPVTTAPPQPPSSAENSPTAPRRSSSPSTGSRGTGGGGSTGAGSGSSALFSGPGSPWGQVLAASAAVDPNSSGYVSAMQGEKFLMSFKQWTVPVYYADASTPRQTVRLTEDWGASELRNVPVPANAKPDPSEDAHLSIVDRSTGCVYDFWGAKGGSGGLSASWGNAIPTNSNGIYPGGMGSRGSGFSAAAGIVTADELRRGVINHALVFAYPQTKSGGPVAPATKSDGTSGGGNALPEGARMRLDPSLNLKSLGLNKYELTIATAMQKYGMILGDTSGGFTIYAQHPQSAPGAFTGLLPDDTWVDLTKIPTEKLQVMKLPAQASNKSFVVGNRCNGW